MILFIVSVKILVEVSLHNCFLWNINESSLNITAKDWWSKLSIIVRLWTVIEWVVNLALTNKNILFLDFIYDFNSLSIFDNILRITIHVIFWQRDFILIRKNTCKFFSSLKLFYWFVMSLHRKINLKYWIQFFLY